MSEEQQFAAKSSQNELSMSQTSTVVYMGQICPTIALEELEGNLNNLSIKPLKIELKKFKDSTCAFLTYENVAVAEEAISRAEGLKLLGGVFENIVLDHARSRFHVFVSNIPEEATLDDLKKKFAEFNPSKVRIVKPKKEGKKVFGFVVFTKLSDAKNAIKACDESMMGENCLVVEKAKRRPQKKSDKTLHNK